MCQGAGVSTPRRCSSSRRPSPASHLDAGCGSGPLSDALRDRGAVVTGIDASAGTLALARRWLGDDAALHYLEDWGLRLWRRPLHAMTDAFSEPQPDRRPPARTTRSRGPRDPVLCHSMCHARYTRVGIDRSPLGLHLRLTPSRRSHPMIQTPEKKARISTAPVENASATHNGV
ncbi:class I SAM-dependent methyltransferase [Nonomuraea jabiensis]|uniref:class I SAM-dependent methyltransferase n=1 Tax=Nonomuraea jabiensis TaxID=882448 RepID=UPI003D71E619